MRAGATKKVIVDFPERLYEETKAAARELSTNRSQLVRSAVEQYLQTLQRQKLEQRLIEGYRRNADLDRRIADDFAFVDAENL
jgi:metal-responsive CopG/Arc/MetJ family transcriptional regulator